MIYVGFIWFHVAHFHSDHVQGGKLMLCSDCGRTRVALFYCETGGGSKKRKIQSDLAIISGEQRAVGHCIASPTCWTYWWKTRHDSPKPPNRKVSRPLTTSLVPTLSFFGGEVSYGFLLSGWWAKTKCSSLPGPYVRILRWLAIDDCCWFWQTSDSYVVRRTTVHWKWMAQMGFP